MMLKAIINVSEEYIFLHYMNNYYNVTVEKQNQTTLKVKIENY